MSLGDGELGWTVITARLRLVQRDLEMWLPDEIEVLEGGGHAERVDDGVFLLLVLREQALGGLRRSRVPEQHRAETHVTQLQYLDTTSQQILCPTQCSGVVSLYLAASSKPCIYVQRTNTAVCYVSNQI